MCFTVIVTTPSHTHTPSSPFNLSVPYSISFILCHLFSCSKYAATLQLSNVEAYFQLHINIGTQNKTKISYDLKNTLTFNRWSGKAENTEGSTSSFKRTVSPVRSKSSGLKWQLQRTVVSLGWNSILLRAMAHVFLAVGSFGNLRHKKAISKSGYFW